MAKFEASVWEIPEATRQGKGNATLIKKVQQGIGTLKDLMTGGAIQRGIGGALDYPCTDDAMTARMPSMP